MNSITGGQAAGVHAVSVLPAQTEEKAQIYTGANTHFRRKYSIILLHAVATSARDSRKWAKRSGKNFARSVIEKVAEFCRDLSFLKRAQEHHSLYTDWCFFLQEDEETLGFIGS